MRNTNVLASLYRLAGWFESHFVGILEDRFSHVATIEILHVASCASILYRIKINIVADKSVHLYSVFADWPLHVISLAAKKNSCD